MVHFLCGSFFPYLKIRQFAAYFGFKKYEVEGCL